MIVPYLQSQSCLHHRSFAEGCVTRQPLSPPKRTSSTQVHMPDIMMLFVADTPPERQSTASRSQDAVSLGLPLLWLPGDPESLMTEKHILT